MTNLRICRRGSRRLLPVAALMVVAALGIELSPAGAAGAATTRRVSVSSAGVQGDSASSDPSISADGRFVALASDASNLVRHDSNAQTDVFVYDRSTRRTRRVSVSSTGVQGDSNSYRPSISADGRFVAFISNASNLVAHDTNAKTDVFVYDRSTRKTRRVSVSSAGVQGDLGSYGPSISADGRFVAFDSDASNLVRHDSNVRSDVFVYDRSTRKTRRVSVSSTGVQGDLDSYEPSITADGRFVAFESNTSNLVGSDTNVQWDVFVYDRSTRKTRRVSVSSTGTQGDLGSFRPSISADGRFVAFESYASNLVGSDTNTYEDVFVYDRSTRKLRRVSVNSVGVQGDSASSDPSISADGRFVALASDASNLVGHDTNAQTDVFVYDRSTRKIRRVSVSSAGTQGDLGSDGASISAHGRFVAFYSYASNLIGADTNGVTDVFIRGPLR